MRSEAFRLRSDQHSDIFVPFLCAVLGVPHTGTAALAATIDAYDRGLWEQLLARYRAELRRRGIHGRAVRWHPVSVGDNPYMDAQEQMRLVDPVNDPEAVVDWELYGRFTTAALSNRGRLV